MACTFPAKRTEDQICSIKTQIKPVCGRTTIVSLNRRSLGKEEARNTQDNDNEHTSIHGRAHLPKMTTDHRRDINIFTVCWKKRTSDKIKHRTSTNNGSHVENLYFALNSALTSRANPTMPTTRPWEPTTCVSLQRVNWTAFCQRRDSIVVELQCSNTIPSNLRSEAQSLLPGFVAVSSRCRPASQPLSRTHVVTDHLAHPRVGSGEI